MRVHAGRTLSLLCIAASLSACGSSADSVSPGGPPSSPPPTNPPTQSAALFPASGTRTLQLASVNGAKLPTTYYAPSDSSYKDMVDSATITFQPDSMVVFRSFRHVAYSGMPTAPSLFQVQLGRGVMVHDTLLTYTAGPEPDTAAVSADGNVTISFRTHGSTPLWLGEWKFSPTYAGPVLAPYPTVTSFSPVSAPEFNTAFTFHVFGSSFTPQSTVQWVGMDSLTTRYVSSTELTVDVPADYLTRNGPTFIDVSNPGPGGGTTRSTYTIVNPIPRLSSLSITQAVTGSAPVTLTLTGDDFIIGSYMQVNGSTRSSSVDSRTQMTATLTAADLATAGTLQVTVVTGGPGGGISAPLPFTVAGTPAKLLSQVTSDVLQPLQLVADPTRPLLYVTLPSTAPSSPNSVAALDESTGTVVWTLPVAGSPSKLAISDDGQYLYVGALQDSAVTRIVLATHTPDLRIPLGETTVPGATHPFPYRAGALAVVPGQPHTIVISREVIGLTPSDVGLSVWDDSTMRPQSTAGHDYAGSFVFGSSPTTLYGPQWGSTLGAMFAMTIDASGAHDLLEQTGVFIDSRPQFVYASGRLYGSNALVVDAATLKAVGRLVGFGVSDVIAASTDGRTLYTVDQTGRVLAADAANYGAEGSVVVTNAAGGPTSLTRWGSDGLAFIAAGRVFIIRADFVH